MDEARFIREYMKLMVCDEAEARCTYAYLESGFTAGAEAWQPRQELDASPASPEPIIPNASRSKAV
jgi:hypothetical protein